MFSQCDFDFHTRIGVVAKHFDNAPDRLRMLAGLLDDLDHDDLPGLGLDGRLLVIRWDQNVLIDPAVLGHHKSDPVLDKDTTNHAIVDVLQHLDDSPFTAPLAIEPGYPNQHAVAMQHTAHLLGIKIDIVAFLVRAQEAESVLVSFHAAGDQIGALRNDVGAFTVLQQLSLALHGSQTTTEHVELGLLDVEQLTQFFEADGFPLRFQGQQNVFARWQREFVFFYFTLEVRVSTTDFREFLY